MHAERKNIPTVYDDIRTLLQIIPMRHEAELRAAIAVRVEIDEQSEQVLGDSARERLQRVANVPRRNTFDAAISSIEKMGILKVKRRYSNGTGGRVYQRGAAYIMTRESWPAPEVAPAMEQKTKSARRPQPSPPLNSVLHTERGQRSTVAHAQHNISPPVNAGEGTALSGGDLYKDNDEVYDEVDGERSTSLAGAKPSDERGGLITNDALTTKSEEPPVVPRSQVSSTTAYGRVAGASSNVDLPANFGSDPNNLNPFANQVRRNRRYGGLAGLDGSEGVAFDIDSGTLTLVNGTRQTFEREAKARGLDLEAALVKAAAKVAKDPRTASPAYVLAEVRQALSYQEQDKRTRADGGPKRLTIGRGGWGARNFKGI